MQKGVVYDAYCLQPRCNSAHVVIWTHGMCTTNAWDFAESRVNLLGLSLAERITSNIVRHGVVTGDGRLELRDEPVVKQGGQNASRPPQLDLVSAKIVIANGPLAAQFIIWSPMTDAYKTLLRNDTPGQDLQTHFHIDAETGAAT